MVRNLMRLCAVLSFCVLVVHGLSGRAEAYVVMDESMAYGPVGESWIQLQPADGYGAEIGSYEAGMLADRAGDDGDETEKDDAESERTPAPTVRYQVNAGDTLYKIARDFGLTVDEIVAANSISNPNVLSVGQLLNIPVGDAEWAEGIGKSAVVRKVLHSTLTAYTAGAESTGKTPKHPAYGITKSGSRAEEGRTVAVDPSIIPLGSTVLIDGVGVRKAEDTGSAIRGARIDVFMDDVKQALQFGVKKNVKVYILADGRV